MVCLFTTEGFTHPPHPQREILPLALPYVRKSVHRPILEHPRPFIKKLFENHSYSVKKYRLK